MNASNVPTTDPQSTERTNERFESRIEDQHTWKLSRNLPKNNSPSKHHVLQVPFLGASAALTSGVNQRLVLVFITSTVRGCPFDELHPVVKRGAVKARPKNTRRFASGTDCWTDWRACRARIVFTCAPSSRPARPFPFNHRFEFTPSVAHQKPAHHCPSTHSKQQRLPKDTACQRNSCDRVEGSLEARSASCCSTNGDGWRRWRGRRCPRYDGPRRQRRPAVVIFSHRRTSARRRSARETPATGAAKLETRDRQLLVVALPQTKTIAGTGAAPPRRRC